EDQARGDARLLGDVRDAGLGQASLGDDPGRGVHGLLGAVLALRRFSRARLRSGRRGPRAAAREPRHKTGGAADTSAPFPDHPEIKVTTYSYVMSLMPPTIIRELNLKRHGYDVTPFGPYHP